MIFKDSQLGNEVFIGLSGTLSGKLVAVPLMMLLYPTVKRRLVIMRFARRICIKPFIKFGLQSVNVPSGKVIANSDNGALGEAADYRA